MVIATQSASPHRVSAFGGPDHYGDADGIERLIRECLDALALPPGFIRPGDRVVIKPNWVKEHDERFPGPGHWEHVVTHPVVIEATAAFAASQMQGRGSIVFCDASQTDSSFAALREYCKLDEMLARCKKQFPGVSFSLLDLRPEEWLAVDGVTVERKALPGDPLGQTHICLNKASEFVGYRGEGRLYGASYDIAETNQRHAGEVHEYLLCRTPMDADVLINLPKLKTHKKVGVTCALKNLVGINANKNWLPHHTEGTPDMGGDQFPRATMKARLEHSWMGTAKRWLKNRPRASRLFVPVKKIGRVFFGNTQRVVRSGNWHGNDTCWRMVLDLNKCLFNFEGSGATREKPLRYLAIVDGIIAGEGNGPMSADPKACGLILAGTHPVAVDCVAATLMGFDVEKLPLLRNAFVAREPALTSFDYQEIEVLSNNREWAKPLSEISQESVFHFRPHFGWKGAIEQLSGQLAHQASDNGR